MQESYLTSDDVAKGPPGTNVPMSIKFSPDGTFLTYLFPDHNGTRQIFAVDLPKNIPQNVPKNVLGEAKLESQLEHAIEPYRLFDVRGITGTGNDSLEEQLRKERMRLFFSGVTAYEWVKRGTNKEPETSLKSKNKIMLPMSGNILLYDMNVEIHSARLKVIYDSSTEEVEKEVVIEVEKSAAPISKGSEKSCEKGSASGPAIDPHLSPTGNSVAFVVNKNLYVQHVRTSSTGHPYEDNVKDDSLFLPIQLTVNGDRPGVSCGLADFIAQEEMDRYEGFWWSPCGTMIAYTESDESHVPEYTIHHQGKADPKHSETHKYPFAGEKNPIVTLHVVKIPPHPEILPESTASPANNSRTFNFTANDIMSLGAAAYSSLTDVLTETARTVSTPCTGSVPMQLTTFTSSTSTPQQSKSDLGSDSGISIQDPSLPAENISWRDREIVEPQESDYYLARVGWFPDGSVMAQVQNREQTMLQLLRLDPETGKRTVLIEEKNSTWINLHHMTYSLSLGWKPNKNIRKEMEEVNKETEKNGERLNFTSNRKPEKKDRKDEIENNGNHFYFIWASERSGYRQLYLYLYGFDGEIGNTEFAVCCNNENPIGGGGHWIVDSIDGVDEENELIYFSGNKFNHTQQQLFVSSFSPEYPSKVDRLSVDEGWHLSTLDVHSRMYCDMFSSVDCPPVLRLYLLPPPHSFYSSFNQTSPPSLPTSPSSLSPSCVLLSVLFNSIDSDTRLVSMINGLSRPHIERIPLSPDSGNKENEIDDEDEAGGLFCALYKPDAIRFGDGPYPTIVSVYGGPGPQRVNNIWMMRVDLRAQRLAQEGFLVIRCDNRGSARRGLEFEGAIKWNMGEIELTDQIQAVKCYATKKTYKKNICIKNSEKKRKLDCQDFNGEELNSEKNSEVVNNDGEKISEMSPGIVNLNQVGIYGWSYGGYLSAMAVCRSPYCDFFQCAVAGAPVTSWDGYDTHYTERYMGLPSVNQSGYETSSVLSHTSTMKGKILLVHGLIDENVHFRHTARLINSLMEQRKQYDLVLFPCERHSPHKLPDRVYLEDRIQNFFLDNLYLPPVKSVSELRKENRNLSRKNTDSDIWRDVGDTNTTPNIFGEKSDSKENSEYGQNNGFGGEFVNCIKSDITGNTEINPNDSNENHLSDDNNNNKNNAEHTKTKNADAKNEFTVNGNNNKTQSGKKENDADGEENERILNNTKNKIANSNDSDSNSNVNNNNNVKLVAHL